MSADEVSSPVEPVDVDSKKRKVDIEEIEVDLNLPEPPSKKAKRALKKGKTLPAKKDSDDEDDEDVKEGLPPKNAGKNGKENKRSEFGIWIGNLRFTVTRVELFKWLVESSGGAIKEESITRVNLPTSKIKAPGTDKDSKPQNRGFAYIDFDNEATMVAAMALTETEWNGRKVLIKSSKSFEGRPAKEASAANGAAGAAGAAGAEGAKPAAPANTSRKIFVGNLSFQVTEDDLRHQFEKCGEIEFLKLATFEDSGKCKGFGWVRFKEAEAAESAVKGFVKIKEEIETEDDFKDEEEKEDNDEEEDAENKEESKPERKYKTRKWWVNRLKGRELKIQFAEDDQVRYKKRFGKDKPQGERKEFAPRRQDRRELGSGPAKPSYGETGVASYLTGSVVKSEGKKTTFD